MELCGIFCQRCGCFVVFEYMYLYVLLCASAKLRVQKALAYHPRVLAFGHRKTYLYSASLVETVACCFVIYSLGTHYRTSTFVVPTRASASTYCTTYAYVSEFYRLQCTFCVITLFQSTIDRRTTADAPCTTKNLQANTSIFLFSGGVLKHNMIVVHGSLPSHRSGFVDYILS